MNRLSWLKYVIGGACTLGLAVFAFTMLHLYRNATRSDAVMDKLDRAGLLMELSKKDVELAELKARLAILKAAGDPQKSVSPAPVAPSASSTPTPQARPGMPRMNRDDLDKLPTSELIKRWQDGGDDSNRFLLFVTICHRDDLPVNFLLDQLRSAPDPLSRGDQVASNLDTVIQALERLDQAGKHPVRPEVLPFLTWRDLPVRKAARTYLVSVGGDAMLDRWFDEIRKIRELGTDSARAEISASVAEVVLRGWMTAERICLHREYPLIADIEQELARKDLGKYFGNEDHPSDAANRLKSYHAAESEYDRRSALEHYARNPGSDPATIRQLLRQEIERSRHFFSFITAAVLGQRETGQEIPDEMLVWLKGEDFIKRKTAAAYFIGRGDAKAAEQLLAHLEQLAAADPKDKIRAMVLRDQWSQINTYRWTVIMMEKCNDGKTRVARLRAIAASRS